LNPSRKESSTSAVRENILELKFRIESASNLINLCDKSKEKLKREGGKATALRRSGTEKATNTGILEYRASYAGGTASERVCHRGLPTVKHSATSSKRKF
jgi:hypothetical protein